MSAIFTRRLNATDVVTVSEGNGATYVSVLCKTDNSGAAGITILGTGGLGGLTSNTITLLANESITIQSPDGRNIGDLTITAGASSTGIVVSM
jgi:hypothetical protein